MNSINAISLSGMNAASLGLSVSAHNVANAQTPDFRRQQTAQSAQAEGGVAVEITRSRDTGVSLEAEAVQQMQLVYLFKANVCVVQVQNSLYRSLLDLRA